MTYSKPKLIAYGSIDDLTLAACKGSGACDTGKDGSGCPKTSC